MLRKSEIPMKVNIKISIFYNVTPCSFAFKYTCCGGSEDEGNTELRNISADLQKYLAHFNLVPREQQISYTDSLGRVCSL